MTDLKAELGRIRERAEAATEGPWNHWPEAGEIELFRQGPAGRYDVQEVIASSIRPKEGWGAIYKRDGARIYRDNSEPDAEFIAHARTDVPRLVEEVERLTKELEKTSRGAQTLGRIIEQQCRDVLDATGMHHVIDETGDGDWGLVWERLAEMGRAAGHITDTEEGQ